MCIFAYFLMALKNLFYQNQDIRRGNIMKKVFSSPKTAIILLLVTVLFLGYYAYMLIRPISYGMNYDIEMVYDGETFKESFKYYSDGRVVCNSSGYNEEMTYYYYYSNGYVFNLIAETEEECQEEIDYINANFDEAVSSPYYATKTNAFCQVDEFMDENDANLTYTYTCTGAIIFAIVGGVGALLLVALTVFSFVLFKKAKAKEMD